MPYLSLSSIVAEANRAASDAERLLDMSFQPLPPEEPEEPDVKKKDPVKPPEDNSGFAALSLNDVLKKAAGLFGTKQ